MSGNSSRLLIAVLAFVGLLPAAVFAACPAAPVGSTSDTVVILKHLSDSAGIGPTSRLDATREGSLVYDSVAKSLKYCDGTNWTELSMGGRIVTGSYVGNGAASQTVALGFRPSMVLVKGVDGTFKAVGMAIDGISNAAVHLRLYSGGTTADTVQIQTTSNGFNAIGSGPNDSSFNFNGRTFHYVAIGSTAVEQTCPAGFTSIAAQGRSLGCMQTAENAAATWPNANNACFTTYGGRLPTSSEWHIAMANFTLTGETGNMEWLADYSGGGSPWDDHGQAGSTSITDFYWNYDSTTATYRCFLPN